MPFARRNYEGLLCARCKLIPAYLMIKSKFIVKTTHQVIAYKNNNVFYLLEVAWDIDFLRMEILAVSSAFGAFHL